ncbi:MAG: response regulator transcription factor [Bacteroidia bacterium]|nr:response regulator transcription factor [Bacteroidia bacterium]
MNFLLLEDDFTLSKEIRQFLLSRDFTCDTIYDGSLFFKQLKNMKYDFYILDVNVPGLNGIEICTAIRETDKTTPILMLTAFGELEDKVTAFNSGADDYLVKPFHFEELYVRIIALLKRKDKPQLSTDKILIEDLEINTSDSTVTRAGKDIKLSPKEYQLLVLMAKANGRLVSKQTIGDQIWDYQIETTNNTIEVYINFLRKKIDKNFPVKLIHTRPGFGYFLKAE